MVAGAGDGAAGGVVAVDMLVGTGTGLVLAVAAAVESGPDSKAVTVPLTVPTTSRP